MTNFKSEYQDGCATFCIGEETRRIRTGLIDYHAISALINEARKIGAQDATKRLVAVVNEWSEQ